MTRTLISQRLLVERSTIETYAHLTADFNPIHLDDDFAARGILGRIVAHGTLSVNLIWQAAAATLGDQKLCGATLDIRFTRPVYPGDIVEAGGMLAEDAAFDVFAKNQHDEPVVEGKLRLASALED